MPQWTNPAMSISIIDNSKFDHQMANGPPIRVNTSTGMK